MKRVFGVATVVAFVLICNGVGAREVRVITSFLPLYCFASNVAGTAARVDCLLSANVNPHDYQLSVKDRARVEAADLVVLNGLGLDNWVHSVLRGASANKRIVTVSDGLSNELIRHSGVPNPHIWLDPLMAIYCVTNIAAALAEVDPEHAAMFAENGSRYMVRLQQLDAQLREELQLFRDRPIVTFHDSFPYFARRYALNIVGVIEEVPDVAPSARQRSRLYATIREKKPRCIFAEAQFSSRLAEQIGEDLHVDVAMLNTLETGLLKPERYEELMRENLRTLEAKLK